ncbi:MAG: YabP/YqfC family sporulation protein [Clostridia bacterium]|nr:YabP/YqfC family sporulation protein [Clostridia bacterium]
MHLNAVLPPEATAKESRIILTGDRSLLIEGHQGLLSYDSHCIKARLKHALLICTGNDLTISQFACDEMQIKGQVLSLEFSS